MKTVAVLQPAYLPWLGFFERVAQADLVIALDHVQIDRNSKTGFANRNRVRTPQGAAWLTVPLRKGPELALDQLAIDGERWRAKHWATIEQNYRRAPHFAQYAPELESVYARDWTHLVPLCMHTTWVLAEALGIDTPWRASSQMEARGTKSELILELCRESGATHYLSGPFGRTYLDRAAFERAGIGLRFHDYVHPTYRQSYPGFEPNLCAYDLLFHAGRAAKEILCTSSEARAA